MVELKSESKVSGMLIKELIAKGVLDKFASPQNKSHVKIFDEWLEDNKRNLREPQSQLLFDFSKYLKQSRSSSSVQRMMRTIKKALTLLHTSTFDKPQKETLSRFNLGNTNILKALNEDVRQHELAKELGLTQSAISQKVERELRKLTISETNLIEAIEKDLYKPYRLESILLEKKNKQPDLFMQEVIYYSLISPEGKILPLIRVGVTSEALAEESLFPKERIESFLKLLSDWDVLKLNKNMIVEKANYEWLWELRMLRCMAKASFFSNVYSSMYDKEYSHPHNQLLNLITNVFKDYSGLEGEIDPTVSLVLKNVLSDGDAQLTQIKNKFYTYFGINTAIGFKKLEEAKFKILGSQQLIGYNNDEQRRHIIEVLREEIERLENLRYEKQASMSLRG